MTDRADTRLGPPVRSKLAAAARYLAVVEPVVRVALDAPVRLDRADRLPAEPADPERLAELSRALGAERLGRAPRHRADRCSEVGAAPGDGTPPNRASARTTAAGVGDRHQWVATNVDGMRPGTAVQRSAEQRVRGTRFVGFEKPDVVGQLGGPTSRRRRRS